MAYKHFQIYTLTLTPGIPTEFNPVILYKCPASVGWSSLDAVVMNRMSICGPPKAAEVICFTDGTLYSAKTLPVLKIVQRKMIILTKNILSI